MSAWSIKDPEAWSAVATTGAVFVALFWNDFLRWLRRPRLELHFDPESDRCKRTVTLLNDGMQGSQLEIHNSERTYLRLQVLNRGGLATGVECKVDLFDLEGKEKERFEPSMLRWVEAEEGVSITLSAQEITYINALSILERATASYPTGVVDMFNKMRYIETAWISRPGDRRVRVELVNHSARGIAHDRPLEDFLMRISLFCNEGGPVTLWVRFHVEGRYLEKISGAPKGYLNYSGLK